MILFAIRQISTGFYLPSGGKGIRGHTHQQPTNVRPPRLFLLSRTAKCALTCYLEGKWSDKGSYDSYTGEYDYNSPEPLRDTKRDPKDFEVVKLRLTNA